MAKKRRQKRRTDAERRARQCERMSRLLRILRHIMGPGRWDAEALAQEFECSPRTIHRYLQTLSMAGIPFYFDQEQRAYRVQAGFRFPGLETPAEDSPYAANPRELMTAAKQLLENGEQFLDALRDFCRCLEETSRSRPE